MNANELAVYLEDITDSENSPYRQAATMLRQQQTYINSLRNNGYKTQYELLRIEFLNQQAEIDALKNLKAENDALDKKLFESIQKSNEMWDRAAESLIRKAKK